MVKYQILQTEEKPKEYYVSLGYKVDVPNSPTRLQYYCPVRRNRLNEACTRYGLLSSVTEVESKCKDAFTSSYVLDETSAVLFPMYVVDKPANRSDINEEETEESEVEVNTEGMGSEDDDDFMDEEERAKMAKIVAAPKKAAFWDARSEHDKFFIDAVNLLKYKDGKHPLIIYPEDMETEPKYIYFDMKKPEIHEVAEKFYGYLIRNKKITTVFIPDISLARILFPDLNIAKSLRDAAFMVYDTYLDVGRPMRVMILPSPIQLNKLEEKGWEFCQEILEIAKNKKQNPVIPFEVVDSLDRLKVVLNELETKGVERIAVDTETTGLNPVYYRQAIISCAFSDGVNSWVFLVNHPKKPEFDGSEMLKYLLTFEGIPIQIYQNAKYDVKWFKHLHGVVPKVHIRDTMLIDHWLHENFGSLGTKIKVPILSMDSQIPRYLFFNSHKGMVDKYLENVPLRNTAEYKKAKDMDITDDLLPIIERHQQDMFEPKSGAYAEIPIPILLEYNAKDTWMTCNIYDKMMSLVREELGDRDLPRVITELHEKQILSTAEMELLGAPINYDYLVEMVEKASTIAKEKSRKIIACINVDLWEKRPKTSDGEEKRVVMNLESQTQLLYYLEAMYGIKKSKFWNEDKNKVIADEDSLLSVCDKDVPWIRDYIVFKKAIKARNTYLIPFAVKSYKGRLYFNLNITGTATGRLSSDRPNLQNLPVSFMGKSKMDRIDIKQIIEAPEGDLMWGMDFKALEMKVLTVYCKDPTLIKGIKEGLDLHCYTASLVNKGTTYEEILNAHKRSEMKGEKDPLTDREHELLDMRQAAKRVIFGVVYGIGAKGLYSKIPLPQTLSRYQKMDRAQLLLDNLKNKAYPELLNTFALTDKTILARGYVETIFGRRRRFHFSLAKVISDIFFKADLVALKKHSNVDRLYRFPAEAIRDIVPSKRAFRQGLNFLVQSSGSDYTQLFINKFRELTKGKFGTTLLFTVHDSCVGTFNDVPGSREFIDEALKEAGLYYIRTIDPESLPVDIGYSYEITKKYCENH